MKGGGISMAQPRSKTLLGLASLLNIINSALYAVISFYLVVLVSIFTDLDPFVRFIFSGLLISGGIVIALSIGQWVLSLLSPARLKKWLWFLWVGLVASMALFTFWTIELFLFQFFSTNQWLLAILTVVYSLTPSLLLGLHLVQLYRHPREIDSL